MRPPMKVRTALACDDIRTEDNGKLIAIGIASPVVNVFPERTPPGKGGRGVLTVHFLLSIDVTTVGEHKLEFRIRTSSGKIGSGVRMGVEFTAAETDIPFPIGPFRIPISAGERGFSLQLKAGERWSNVAKWSFEQPVSAFAE